MQYVRAHVVKCKKIYEQSTKQNTNLNIAYMDIISNLANLIRLLSMIQNAMFFYMPTYFFPTTKINFFFENQW